MKKRVLIGGIILALVIAAVLMRRFGNSEDQGVLALSGNVEVTEVNVGFKIPGRVVTLLTDEGQEVRKGDKIAVLDSAEYKSIVAQNQANYRNAGALFEKAQKDYERAQMLFAKEVISIQQMEAAKTTFDVARAQNEQAAAVLRTGEIRLTDTALFAPVTGVVLR